MATTTTGTKTAAWFSLLTAIFAAIDPGTVAALIGGSLGQYIPAVFMGLSWLLHATTGNSPMIPLPKITISLPNDPSQNLG